MTFDNLPKTWPSEPVDSQQRAIDVVDLLLHPSERSLGCAFFILLDQQRRPVPSPILIGDVGSESAPNRGREGLAMMLHVCGESLGQGAALVFALGRDGSAALTDRDREWHQCVIDLARETRIELYAACLATPAGVRVFPDHLTSECDALTI